MTAYRILVVDDEPDIRRVVERSLLRDPELYARCCASGSEALLVAAEWSPDLILLDMMMPVMDGPATLAALQRNPKTARIPVVFLTARAQAQDLDDLRALGARSTIAKPFEPKDLRDAVRAHLRQAEAAPPLSGPLDEATPQEQAEFRARLRLDGQKLRVLRTALQGAQTSDPTFGELRALVHKLAGAGGMFGFDQISQTAFVLENAIVATASGLRPREGLEADLDVLMQQIDREQADALDPSAASSA